MQHRRGSSQCPIEKISFAGVSSGVKFVAVEGIISDKTTSVGFVLGQFTRHPEHILNGSRSGTRKASGPTGNSSIGCTGLEPAPGPSALGSTDTSSLRSLVLGGWASTPRRVTQAIERFGPIVAQGYGTNEIGQVTWLTPEEHLRPELLTTVGRPVPGLDLSIRDSTGERVGAGEAGEIWVRGPDLMTGYYQQPEETATVLRDGWFRSGDLGFLDSEGYLSVVGRSADVIIIAGGHVYPSDVENVLLQHPGIQSAAVFGVTAGDNDERVCAAVVPTPTGRLHSPAIRMTAAG